MAKISKNFESLRAKIWVMEIMAITKNTIISIENMPMEFEIIKNQNENPALTANALNRGEDSSILNRIDKCH